MTRRMLILMAAAVAVWFAGDRLAAGILAAVIDRSKDPIAQLYGGRGGADVVLVGNSRAYRGFDLDLLSREFNGRVISLALPGASIELSDALVDDYLARYGAPRIAIVELSGLVAGPDALKELRMYVERSDRLAGLLRDHFPNLYYFGRLSHLFNFNSTMALNVAHKFFYPLPDLRLHGVLSAAAAAKAPQGTYFRPRPEQIAAARALIGRLRSRAIDVRLVLLPVEKNFADRNRIEDLQAAARYLAAESRLWDVAGGPPANARHFADNVHLNANGVAVFMATLKARGFFR